MRNLLLCGLILIGFDSLAWADEEIIRPDADGWFTGEVVKSGCTYEWDCVDEAVADDDGTYLKFSATGTDASSFCSDATFVVIDSIKVTIRCKQSGGLPPLNCWSAGYVWSDGEASYYVPVDTFNLSTSYVNYTTVAITVDENSNAWTIATLATHSFGIRQIATLPSGKYLAYTQGFVTIYGTAPAVPAIQKIFENNATAQIVASGTIMRIYK